MFIFFLKKKKVLLLVSLTELVKCRLSLRLFLLFQMPVLTEHRLPRCLNWYRFFRFFFFNTDEARLSYVSLLHTLSFSSSSYLCDHRLATFFPQNLNCICKTLQSYWKAVRSWVFCQCSKEW